MHVLCLSAVSELQLSSLLMLSGWDSLSSSVTQHSRGSWPAPNIDPSFCISNRRYFVFSTWDKRGETILKSEHVACFNNLQENIWNMSAVVCCFNPVQHYTEHLFWSSVFSFGSQLFLSNNFYPPLRQGILRYLTSNSAWAWIRKDLRSYPPDWHHRLFVFSFQRWRWTWSCRLTRVSWGAALHPPLCRDICPHPVCGL